MGPARLTAILRRWDPAGAWQEVRAGRAATDPAIRPTIRGPAEAVGRAWRSAVVDPVICWDAVQAAGIGVALLDGAGYPTALAGDIEPAPVLFHRGDLDVLAGCRVAVVGTRRCSAYGREVAFELGRELAEAGIAVVSGLALGIDGAAHAGALAVDGAPPVAVVGSGLDVVYPARHDCLWREVERRGVVLSEAPLGAAPEPWRFPARNRLIAGLADVVVVVESHERGGSLHTVGEANRRSIPVLAVPGPVRSPASLGTNRLLADGAGPVCDVGDVLVALGLSPGATRPSAERRPPPSRDGRAVLDALGWQASALDQLAARTGLALGALATALASLEAAGWVTVRGPWYERVAR
jgi:DNA processing protein